MLGSFETKGIIASRPPMEQPSLRITGSAVLGSVEVIAKGPPDARLKRLTQAGLDALGEVGDGVSAEVEKSRRRRR